MITCRGSFSKYEHFEQVSAVISDGGKTPTWLYKVAPPMSYPPGIVGSAGFIVTEFLGFPSSIFK